MAERDVRALSILVWAATLVVGLWLTWHSGAPSWQIALAAAAVFAAQQLTVPAPSGERLHLGAGVAIAIVLLIDSPVTAGASFAVGMAAGWFIATFGRSPRRLAHAQYVAEAVALLAMTITYYAVFALVRFGLTVENQAQLVAATAAGAVWYLSRAAVRAITGLDRDDLSPRYLWLLALDDWSVVVSLFATGALYGLAQPTMGLWAIPVAVMPYLFSHLAFLRYHGTRRTYRQTIRALARIPEVAGLAPDGHAERTAQLSVNVAQELGMSPEIIELLEYAALMHDIGRITLNEPAILRAGYTDEDIARWGAQIVAEAPYLSDVATMVADQFRPYRSPGEERDPDVSASSKIIKVASAYDKAVHELGLRPIEALEQLHRGSAYDFDPLVTASLRRVLAHRGEVAA